MAQQRIKLEAPKRETNIIREASGLPVSDKQRPAPKFVYVHYPDAWRYDLDCGFLPNLSRISAIPGVNGVGSDGSLTRVLSSVRSLGGTFIDPKDHRLGDEFMDYVRFYPTSDGRKWYVDFCQEATVLPTGQIVWNNSEVVEPKKRFAAAIRDSGIIEPLLHEFYVSMVEKERAKLDRLYGRIDRNPSIKTKVTLCENRLAGMQRDWDKMTEELLSKSGKKRTNKRISKEVADV